MRPAPAADWLRFHCGVALVGPGAAAFPVCLSLPPLASFDWGSHDGPETSATVILQIPSFEDGPRLRLSGPGLREPETVRLGALPTGFVDEWRANHAAYPRGVDLVLCAGTPACRAAAYSDDRGGVTWPMSQSRVASRRSPTRMAGWPNSAAATRPCPSWGPTRSTRNSAAPSTG